MAPGDFKFLPCTAVHLGKIQGGWEVSLSFCKVGERYGRADVGKNGKPAWCIDQSEKHSSGRSVIGENHIKLRL